MSKGKITLNVLPTVSVIYITDVISDFTGYTTFKLHVENAPFIGYANTVATRGSNTKRITANFSPYGNDILISATTTAGVNIYRSEVVNIPVGVYDCNIDLSVIPLSAEDFNTTGDAAISFGLTQDFYSSNVVAECHYGDQAASPARLIPNIKKNANYANVNYCGVAPEGSLETESVWTITKITVALNGTVTEKVVVEDTAWSSVPF